MATLRHEHYTVGWICALPIELTAATAMLDEHHSSLPQHPLDHNTYILGRVGSHNVVIACLPLGQTGTTSAAIVAVHLQYSFRSVKFGMMVGIGGGVPSGKHDIRLGDVVVSKPSSGNGGVVQYDFGKTVQDGVFKHTGSLNVPPMVLLTALGAIQSKHDFQNPSFVSYLSEIPAALKPKYTYPGQENDRLFNSEYDHVDGNPTCDSCDTSQLITRQSRPSKPHVHYGTIASANEVMSHGVTRDRLRQQFNVLCFEMEAAGLINNFPCVVIRGISDYSDSHKNYGWQPYAALTAAAYAKELLNFIPVKYVSTASTLPIHAGSHFVSTATSEQPTTVFPDPYTSTTSTYTPDNSILVLNYRRLPTASVSLGRLVTNICAPWEDYCPHPLNYTDDDVGITVQPRLRDMLESVKGTDLYQNLLNLLSATIGRETSNISKSERTYFLSNAGYLFKQYCGGLEIRSWLEFAIDHGKDVYMVVGLHTLQNSAVHSMALSGMGSESRIGGSEDVILGVQYRKVQFKWFWSRDVGSAFLEMGTNRWELFEIIRTDEGEAEIIAPEDTVDIIEADLQAYISREDVQHNGEVYQVEGQLIVFN